MDVTTAIAARRSVRGFLDRDVDIALLRELATKAARAASGGNLQPWHIDLVHGAALSRLKAVMATKISRGEIEGAEYAIYPAVLTEDQKRYRYTVGESLYAAIGIPREDKAARQRWFANNFQFFGAPAALFVTVDRNMGPPQWSDLGQYLASFMLLAVEAGLATCAQECWAMYPETIRGFLGTPAERMLFCGMAIGYEDPEAPANALRTERAAEDAWLRILG